MFSKRNYRLYRGVKRESVYPQVCDFWARNGFYVAQVSPYHIRGESYHSKIGLKREFELRLDEQGGDTYADLHFAAKITDTGLIGGAVAAVIFWPVALVGGAISYSDYEGDANNLMGSFWAYLDQVASIPGAPAGMLARSCADSTGLPS